MRGGKEQGGRWTGRGTNRPTKDWRTKLRLSGNIFSIVKTHSGPKTCDS